jgi:hypothetical protein
LTGTQIRESKLGKVPKAAAADTATSATSATNATNATNATTAANSNALGGLGSAGYQKAANIVFGTITTSASGATVIPERSRGMTGATRNATGFYQVTFNRDVSNCTWIATGGNASGSVPPYIATTRVPSAGPGSPNTDVGIVIFNDAGTQVDGASVFVEALCP